MCVCLCVGVGGGVGWVACVRESTSDVFSHCLEAEQVSLQATLVLTAVQAHPATNCCDSEGGDWTQAEESGA